MSFLTVIGKILFSIPVLIAVLIGFCSWHRNKVGENGYGFTSTAEEVAQGFDLQNKVAIVTGATNGLGFESSRIFAAHGAHVIITGRNLAKAMKAKTQIQDLLTQNGQNYTKITAMELDISDLSSIEKFVKDFKSLRIPLHILMNNAGIMALPSRQLTVNGFEMQMGVNHLGHFHLTNLLVEKLKKSAPSRIVVVSSMAHGSANLDFITNPNLETDYDPMVAYGNSKLANIIHAAELDRRFSKDGIRAYSLHPGVIDTGLFKHVPKFIHTIMSIIRPILDYTLLKTVEQGAATQVYAALNAKDLDGGNYFDNCQVSETKYPEVVLNEELRTQFWDVSQNLVSNAQRL